MLSSSLPPQKNRPQRTRRITKGEKPLCPFCVPSWTIFIVSGSRPPIPGSTFLPDQYLVRAGSLQLDQIPDRNVLQPERPHLFHVIGVDAHRFQFDELLDCQVV